MIAPKSASMLEYGWEVPADDCAGLAPGAMRPTEQRSEQARRLDRYNEIFKRALAEYNGETVIRLADSAVIV